MSNDTRSNADETILHASAVAFEGQGVLILGPSGAGKSVLALALMALGGRLISDDRTILQRVEGAIVARAPDAIKGRIEARYVGILGAAYAGPQRIDLVVDCGTPETERLPPKRQIKLLGESLALIHNSETRLLAAAIVQYLRGARSA